SDKEKILKLLRSSLLNSAEQVAVPEINDDELYYSDEDPVMTFAEKITDEGGKFIYCQNEGEMFYKLKTLISYRHWNNIASASKNLCSFLEVNGIQTALSENNSEVLISLCQGIVSRTGTIVFTSTQGLGTNVIHFPPIFIVIAAASQIRSSLRQVINLLPETPPQWLTCIRSAKFISEEVKELYLFVMDI
ncbi:MAG: LUD domain-containing protein, partial [Bacteroidales bacterium]|nr:LUD domain-containing protein [Bacteroidales bacterium]